MSFYLTAVSYSVLPMTVNGCSKVYRTFPFPFWIILCTNDAGPRHPRPRDSPNLRPLVTPSWYKATAIIGNPVRDPVGVHARHGVVPVPPNPRRGERKGGGRVPSLPSLGFKWSGVDSLQSFDPRVKLRAANYDLRSADRNFVDPIVRPASVL